MNYHTLQALMDFHEFNYEWSVLAYQLIIWDMIHSWNTYIAVELKIPVDQLDSSSPMQS